MARHFYRCITCLAVSAIDGSPLRNPACGACGGQLEHMGRVERDRLVKDAIECVCDYRCTGALGPICNCKCGGVNHGTNRVVQVTYEAGAIPTVTPRNPEQFKAIAAEYKSALDGIYSDFEPLLNAKRTRQWLNDEQFTRLRTLQRTYRKALESRCHKSRMRLLAAYVVAKPAPQIVSFPTISGRTNQAALF